MWSPMAPPFGSRRLRLTRAGSVLEAGRALNADVIIERYYNFGGEGILAAGKLDAVAVLEVNAPVVDAPGSPKQWLDRLMVVEPMRRWREWQCAHADLIVAPSVRMLPEFVPEARILQTEWGADTERFRPDATGPIPFARNTGETIAMFVGAFRPWHGVIDLVRAIGQLHRKGRRDIRAVLIGDGPELARVRAAAEGTGGITIVGPLSHDEIPSCLAAADIGVAPFDVTAHAGLAREFFWSPLKVFEYMASGLPVVAPRLQRLAGIARDGLEAALYESGDPNGLAAALERLTEPSIRARLGNAARARVVEHFSWKSHCRSLDRAIRVANDAHSDRH
jgi:glycosyltransferase involved in cell wall biosynthesis